MLDLALPQLLVPSGSAPNLYHGLRHPLLAPTFLALKMLEDRADISIELDETDNAYGNQRLFAYELGKTADKILKMRKPCSLHQNQLIEVLVLAVLGLNVLSRLYSLTILLHTGGYYLRMLQAISIVVKENVVIRDVAIHGPPPPAAVAYAREIMKYLVCHYKRFEKSQDPTNTAM